MTIVYQYRQLTIRRRKNYNDHQWKRCIDFGCISRLSSSTTSIRFLRLCQNVTSKIIAIILIDYVNSRYRYRHRYTYHLSHHHHHHHHQLCRFEQYHHYLFSSFNKSHHISPHKFHFTPTYTTLLHSIYKCEQN